MRSWPTSVWEFDDNVRWVIDSYLKTIEEFASNPGAFGTGGPGIDEVTERIWLAAERGDNEAEEGAILYGMRVQTRELWGSFPELRLLGDHFRRASLRNAGRGSPGNTDPPSKEDGLRLARAVLALLPGRSLLAQIPDADWLNPEGESEFISVYMAYKWVRDHPRPSLRDYIKRSQTRVYFDALRLIWEELKRRGEDIPRPLRAWYKSTNGGRLRRPPMGPLPKHRPVTMSKFLSDVNIQLTIEILSRIGIRTVGEDFSGIVLVEMALADSEDKTLRLTYEGLRRVWQERLWGNRSRSQAEKYSSAISKRQRLVSPKQD